MPNWTCIHKFIHDWLPLKGACHTAFTCDSTPYAHIADANLKPYGTSLNANTPAAVPDSCSCTWPSPSCMPNTLSIPTWSSSTGKDSKPSNRTHPLMTSLNPTQHYTACCSLHNGRLVGTNCTMDKSPYSGPTKSQPIATTHWAAISSMPWPPVLFGDTYWSAGSNATRHFTTLRR